MTMAPSWRNSIYQWLSKTTVESQPQGTQGKMVSCFGVCMLTPPQTIPLQSTLPDHWALWLPLRPLMRNAGGKVQYATNGLEIPPMKINRMSWSNTLQSGHGMCTSDNLGARPVKIDMTTSYPARAATHNLARTRREECGMAESKP